MFTKLKASGGVIKQKIAHVFQNLRGDKHLAILVTVIVAVVGVGATLATQAGQLVNEEVVVLSNSKEIRLGQSLDSIQKELGKELYKINESKYSYPGSTGRPIEVVIVLADQRVAVIHIVSGRNIVNATNKTVGMSLGELGPSNLRLRGLGDRIAPLRERGITVEQARSKIYHFADPCIDTDRVSMITLATNGHEDIVAKDLGNPGCQDRD